MLDKIWTTSWCWRRLLLSATNRQVRVGCHEATKDDGETLSNSELSLLAEINNMKETDHEEIQNQNIYFPSSNTVSYITPVSVVYFCIFARRSQMGNTCAVITDESWGKRNKTTGVNFIRHKGLRSRMLHPGHFYRLFGQIRTMLREWMGDQHCNCFGRE